MLSENIYLITEQQRSNFKPTYLYIKQHKITGLKYFGKTTRNPYTYNGSGLHWSRHIKHHGKHIETLWTHLFTDIDELVSTALALSELFDIVDSDSWLNIIPENGLNGGFNEESHKKMLLMVKNNIHPFQSDQAKTQRIERNKYNASIGLNPFQSETHKQNTSKRNRQLVEEGNHLWQNKEYIKKQSKKVSNAQKKLIEEGNHSFQKEENKQKTSKRTSIRNKQLSERPLYLEVKQLCKNKNYKIPQGANIRSDEFLLELKSMLEKL